MDWLTPALGSAVISMAVLVAAYAYLYGRRRQSAMGLWALGWTACLGLYFGLLAEMFLPLAMLWRYLSLVLLGLGTFLLWAGTRHFVGYPPPRRAYAWGVLPVIWAGVTFLGLEERPWLAIPIFLFASAASLFTAASLYRYSRSSEGLRGARVAALGYGLWGMLELVYPFVRIMLSPPLGVLPLGLLLANGLTLGLAISLIGLSMWDEERRARQQAEQLESLRTIAAAVSQVLEPDEVLSLVARQAAALVGAETVAVSLISEDGTHLLYKAAYGRWADQLFGQEKPIRSTSICGWVMRTRKGFHSEDLAQDERAVEEIGEMPWLETAISVPLLTRGKAIGAIVAFNKVGGRSFTYADLEQRLQPLADQAAVAIENARLYAAQQRRVQESRILLDIASVVSSTLDLNEVLKHVAQHVAQACGAHRCTILLLAGDEEMLIPLMSQFSDGHVDREMWRLFRDARYPVPVSQVLEMQQVIREQRPLFVPDASASSLPVHWIEPLGVESVLIVPLVSKERVIGLMGLDHVEEGLEFTAEQVDLAMAIAAQAATAVENARLFEEAKRRARQLEALTEIGRAIGSILNLDEVLQLILERLEDVVPYDAVSLWLREGEAMHIRAVRGFEGTEAHIGFAVTLQDDLLSQEMVSTQRPLILADAQQDERFRGLAGTEWVCSWLGVPLLSKGEVIGLVTLNKKEPGLYTAEMAALALAFGQQAAMAIENARLFEETKQRAEEMTALYHTSLEIPTNLPDLLWTICDRAAGLLDVDKGGLYLYDEAREELELVVSYKLGRDFTGTRIKLGEGVAGRVVQTGQPLIVDDYSHWDERTRVYEGEPFATVIGVPLKWQERVIGAISLSEETGRRTFTPDDERLLGLFAQQAAVAIENARLYEGARRHVEELTALHTIDVTIASTLDLDEVLQRVYGQVSTVMDVAAFHIALYDEEKGELHLPIIVDQGKRLPPRTLKVEEESGLSGWVVRTREPLWIEDWDEQRDTLPVKAIALGIPTRSLMVLPLVARDKVVGVMSAQSYEPYAFDEGHRRLFSGIASQVAIVIENARLFEETNRRLAEVRLTQEVMLASASTLDFDLVLERTVKALHRALGIARLGFLLPDEQGGALVPHPSLVGFTEGAFRIPIKGSLVGQAYRTGQPVLVRDVAQEPAYSEVAPGVHSALAVPVRVGDRIIAVLHAESLQVGVFGEDELRLFTTIAGQLGVTLESARLYQRLEVQTTELSQSFGELQEISRLRTELVQNVGHELRTPLGLIQGYVELLLEGDLGRILDSQQAALQVIRERSATLARLIHNLTMLQAVPQGALALAPASVVEVVQHALAEFRRFAEKADIAFQEELPAGLPPVLGDRERLELVFGHLVDNAIKFSPDGGTVTVRAWADENQVYVSVADEGIGIAPDHLDRVFERFYQVDGTTKRRFGGMGVGLALVWEVVEAHGGTVTVESEPGEGSTLTVALPQAEESPVD